MMGKAMKEPRGRRRDGQQLPEPLRALDLGFIWLQQLKTIGDKEGAFTTSRKTALLLQDGAPRAPRVCRAGRRGQREHQPLHARRLARLASVTRPTPWAAWTQAH